jgi:uncharacterized protein (TIGR00725 family)
VPRVAIAVIGAGTCDSDLADIAYEVGRAIAQRGAVLITGGSSGVMEAASRGARSAGGLVVGILPGLDPSEANDAVEVAIPTGMGQLRNGIVAGSAAAVIAVGGEWGTLSEIGFARKLGRPVIGIRTWKLSTEDEAFSDIERADSATEAVGLAWKLASL